MEEILRLYTAEAKKKKIGKRDAGIKKGKEGRRDTMKKINGENLDKKV